jgi:hypothetical protein
MMDVSARVAAALEMSDLVAMCSISSVLFTLNVPIVDLIISNADLCSLLKFISLGIHPLAYFQTMLFVMITGP